MLGRVVGSDWTANALLMNMIISRTRTNSKMCAYTLIYYGAQLIWVRSGSRMPESWALTRILTNSHIVGCSACIAIIFTYLETRSAPQSSYVHYILLCYLPLMSARHCVALLTRALKNLQCSSQLPTPCGRNNALPTPRQQDFRSLATMWHSEHSTCCLGQPVTSFFVVWSNSRQHLLALKFDIWLR